MAIDDIIKMADAELEAVFTGDEIIQGTPFSLEELRNCIVFECIKTAYDMQEEKSSLRSHRGNDDDSKRMQDCRNLYYAQHYRNEEYKYVLEKQGIKIPELLSNDMDSISAKLYGHRINTMQYFELKVLEQYPLFKSIVNKRITSVKKVSNDTFVEYMEGYERLVSELLNKMNGSAEDIIFSAIQLFTIEWKFNVELFYKLAIEAETANEKRVNIDRVFPLCADNTLPFPLNPDVQVTTHSRFIPYRNKLAYAVFSDEHWKMADYKMFNYLGAKLVMLLIQVDGDTLIDDLIGQTTREEWATFINEHFDIAAMYERKKWTSSRIRYVRKLYNEMIRDIHTPQRK